MMNSINARVKVEQIYAWIRDVHVCKPGRVTDIPFFNPDFLQKSIDHQSAISHQKYNSVGLITVLAK